MQCCSWHHLVGVLAALCHKCLALCSYPLPQCSSSCTAPACIALAHVNAAAMIKLHVSTSPVESSDSTPAGHPTRGYSATVASYVCMHAGGTGPTGGCGVVANSEANDHRPIHRACLPQCHVTPQRYYECIPAVVRPCCFTTPCPYGLPQPSYGGAWGSIQDGGWGGFVCSML